MTNLAVVEKSNEVQIAPNKANDFGQVIALKMLELASDPSFDVEKLEKLAELQAKEAHRQDEKEFSQDFANMQAEIPLVIEDKAGNGRSHPTRVRGLKLFVSLVVSLVKCRTPHGCVD